MTHAYLSSLYFQTTLVQPKLLCTIKTCITLVKGLEFKTKFKIKVAVSAATS